ncbi:MAG: hypothetical protein KGI27_13775 [Thaumarchaeota archaeon]|nr:hypothetical protein [Nitrososphaerota archaeon]
MNLQGKSIDNFMKGFHSDSTKESYCKKLSQFLGFCNTGPDELAAKTRKNPKVFQDLFIDYIENRKKEVSGSTLHQFRDALKHFFEMNDIEDINWSKIAKIIPHAKKTGSDRAPTMEEIRTMLDMADIRTKCIVLLCCSSGIRVGAFDGLVWGNVTPIAQKGRTVAAKLVVYHGQREQYHTFVTPECYNALLQYRKLRESAGERITPSSPLIRDTWDNNRYRKQRLQDPGIAIPLTSKSIANQMGEFLKKMKLRESRIGTNYEFKQIHGFRKFFKTTAERAMKTIDVEKLMGHAENYYKPHEQYLLEEYLKAVPYLTISEATELKDKLEQQVMVSDKKVGELERYNIVLQDRLERLERSYGDLKEMITEGLGHSTHGRG